MVNLETCVLPCYLSSAGTSENPKTLKTLLTLFSVYFCLCIVYKCIFRSLKRLVCLLVDFRMSLIEFIHVILLTTEMVNISQYFHVNEVTGAVASCAEEPPLPYDAGFILTV